MRSSLFKDPARPPEAPHRLAVEAALSALVGWPFGVSAHVYGVDVHSALVCRIVAMLPGAGEVKPFSRPLLARTESGGSIAVASASPDCRCSRPGLLPNLIVIGAMKCGTTALHRYLGLHPDIAMSEPKELNFFFGPERLDARSGASSAGNWHRGVEWYARQFRPAPVRGEASPGYTSPSYPEAAERMARVVPDARLVYAVRDPVERAVSQYLHHRADGAERRPIEEALLDSASQYLARSRYYARLEPYLAKFPRGQIFICAQEDLSLERRTTVRELYRFAGVDDSFWSPSHELRWNVARSAPVSLERALRRRLAVRLSDDAARLQELAGREFTGWRL